MGEIKKYISPLHQKVVALALVGRRQIDIAKSTGLSESAISRILRKPIIQDSIGKLNEACFLASQEAILNSFRNTGYFKKLEELNLELDNSFLSDEAQLDVCTAILNIFEAPAIRKKGKPRGRPFERKGSSHEGLKKGQPV